jgi:hypothetical protein
MQIILNFEEHENLHGEKYCFYNFFEDVNFIINDKGDYTDTLNFKELGVKSNAYVFFPFKNRKAIVTYVNHTGLIEKVCLYDDGEIKKFNTHLMPFENAKQMDQIPHDVYELVEMQVKEVEDNAPGSQIFKKWLKQDHKTEKHENYFLTMTHFRMIIGSKDLLNENVTYVNTVTTKQDRFPSSGIVRVINGNIEMKGGIL